MVCHVIWQKAGLMIRAKFITFEGIDGSGKSTQIEMLQQYLEERCQVLCLREPGGSLIGEQIRQIILSRHNSSMSDLTELLLFEAARSQVIAEKIKPALDAGTWVICDRFIDSTTAYQAFGRELDRNLVEQLNAIATGNLRPDLTILLDLSVEAAANRLKQRGEADRLEGEKLQFMEAVRLGYLELAATEPERFVVIDADQGVSEVFDGIISAVDKL